MLSNFKILENLNNNNNNNKKKQAECGYIFKRYW